MKKVISMLCALLMLCASIPAWAAEGEPTITFEEHLGTRICIYTLAYGGEMRFVECTEEEDERFVLGWYLYESENLQGHLEVPDSIDGTPVVGLYYANEPTSIGRHVYCLGRNPELVSVTLPETLKVVFIVETGEDATAGICERNEKLEEIVFTSDGPEVLPPKTFGGVPNLKRVVLPRKISVLDGAFGCLGTDTPDSLDELVLDEDNENFVIDEQGVLYDRDKTKVITAVLGADKRKTVVLPETVTELPDYAFRKNVMLETITGGADNMKVSQKAFSGCTSLNPFRDSYGHWSEESVKWAYQKGILKGVTELRFSVDTPLERGMFCTTLYRMSEDKFRGDASFSDVLSGAYYTEAVAWAQEKGVVMGYADGTFRPRNFVTREQMAAFLYRYAQEKGIEGSKADLSAFADADSVSSYAKDAMEWAVGSGLLKGKNGSRLDPRGQATRAEAAAILQRLAALTEPAAQ